MWWIGGGIVSVFFLVWLFSRDHGGRKGSSGSVVGGIFEALADAADDIDFDFDD